MRALKMRCIMGGHQKWPTTNWESLSKLIFLPPHEKLSKDSTLTILQLFGIWSKLERWKSSVSGCLTSWPQIKKNHRSEVSSALIQQQWTISQLDCDMQWKVNCIWQPVTTSSVVGLRSNSKALPKTKPAPKKGHGHCPVVCCRSDSLQLSESWRNHDIWEACSTNRWDAPKTTTPAAATGQQKGPGSSPWQCPTTCHTTNTSKVEQTGLWSFASSAIFTWPLAKWLPLL